MVGEQAVGVELYSWGLKRTPGKALRIVFLLLYLGKLGEEVRVARKQAWLRPSQ